MVQSLALIPNTISNCFSLWVCDCLCEAIGFWFFQISAEPEKNASSWDISNLTSCPVAFSYQSLATLFFFFPAEPAFHDGDRECLRFIVPASPTSKSWDPITTNGTKMMSSGGFWDRFLPHF